MLIIILIVSIISALSYDPTQASTGVSDIDKIMKLEIHTMNRAVVYHCVYFYVECIRDEDDFADNTFEKVWYCMNKNR